MKILTAIILFYCSSFLKGQPDFDFNYDFAQFKYDSTQNYIEIYYALYPNSFALANKDSNYQIDGALSIILKNKLTDSLLFDKNWEIKKEFADSADYQNQNSLLGVVGISAPQGDYIFNILLRDNLDTSKIKSYSETLKINVSKYAVLSISDIQLASRILNDDVNKNSIFYKNTLEVYPNPSSIFTQQYPILYYYSELYELESASSDTLNLIKKLVDGNGSVLYSKSRQLLSNKKSIVDVGFINLKKYPTASYTLLLELNDTQGNKLSDSKKRFFLINPDVKKEFLAEGVKDYMSSEFGVLSVEECDNMFNQSKIIASADEIDQYEQLDSLDSKREFLFSFWQKRDDVPQTAINEFKMNYFSRINIAVERYGTVTNPGYETDRGRIYARFGEPDEIERHPNETDSKPYEIWFYHQIEGGVYFVFGDYTGFSNYELLHSTLRGELQDPQWMRRLRTN